MTTYSKQIPPIYLECKKRFGVSWDKGIVLTYGDTVYSKFDLEDHVKVHEDVHVKQQLAMGVSTWWNRYFSEPYFRLDQEMEAYKAQLIYIKHHYKPEFYVEAVNAIAKNLSTLYGNLCTYEEAKILLYEATRPTAGLAAAIQSEGIQD